MSHHTHSQDRQHWGRILQRTLALAMALAIAALIAFCFQRFNLLATIESAELKSFDFRQSLRSGPPPRLPSEDIVIVKFDNRTLNVFGNEFGTWPWPRSVHADMIAFLNGHGARAIVYDILFTAPQPGAAESDQALVDAFRNADNVYLSMNFDNEFETLQQVGRDFSYEDDVRSIESLGIDVRIELDPDSAQKPDLDDSGFYRNPAATFNHFQALLPGLIETGERIGFVNHGIDADNVSRGNPLVFRLKYYESLRTTCLPLTRNPKTGRWTDSHDRPVTEKGVLFDENGFTVKNRSAVRHDYYPHVVLQLLRDINYGGVPQKFTLTPGGALAFGHHLVPLDRQGNFLINWYNVDVSRAYHTARIQRLIELRAQVTAMEDVPPEARDAKCGQIDAAIQNARDYLAAPYHPHPYTEISALDVIQATREQKAGRMSKRARGLADLVKNKILFIGATATATYDIKYTPLHNRGTAGVIVPATLFDNLRQNANYLARATPTTNRLIVVALCALAALVTLRCRSATFGVLTALLTAIAYSVVAVVIFRRRFLWLNMAMPVVALMLTTSVAFIAKYIGRDKAYRRTYLMATTDAMTGLANHRLFQDQLRRHVDTSMRYGHRFSLVLLDIDLFRKLNDAYGHEAGDEVLRCVAQKVKAVVRNVDTVARYGGGELAVILDRTDEERGLAIAEALVRGVATTPCPVGRGRTEPVTVSAGLATFPTHGKTPTELIDVADAGMHRAKENGRNRVAPPTTAPNSGLAASS